MNIEDPEKGHGVKVLLLGCLGVAIGAYGVLFVTIWKGMS